MLEPISAAQGKNGKTYLGKIVYQAGEPVACESKRKTTNRLQYAPVKTKKKCRDTKQ